MTKKGETKTLVKSHCWKALKIEDIYRLYGIKYLIANRLDALSIEVNSVFFLRGGSYFPMPLVVYSLFFTELYAIVMILEVITSKS